VDAGQYQIAVLYDHPSPDLGNPQAGWNRKLFSSEVPDAASHTRGRGARRALRQSLGAWLPTMSTSLEATGNNCKMVVQAESLMMAKEHFIEAYGPVATRFHRRIRRFDRAALERQ